MYGFDVQDNCMYTRVLEMNRKDSPNLKFICTSHAGTRSYYDKLQEVIDKVDYGLYEELSVSEDFAEFMHHVYGVPNKYRVKRMGLVNQNDWLKRHWDKSPLNFPNSI